MTKKPRIKVVDAVMGAGKTSWAINFMNQGEGPFLYVTPYLDEIKRILDYCPEFVQPQESRGRNKSDNLKHLLLDGRDIATTHELFKRLDAEAVELIRLKGFTLIMDEVMNVLQPAVRGQGKVQALFNREILKRKDSACPKSISEVEPGPEDRLDEYGQLRAWAQEGRLILVNDTLLMWLFPADVFGAFKEVYNLCYLFDGQYQKAYYQLHGLDFEMLTVVGSQKGDGEMGEYFLSPDVGLGVDPEWRKLIDLYEGKLNDIGNEKHALSRNWYKTKGLAVQKMAKHAYNYFRNIRPARGSELLWTCPKAQEKAMGKRYRRSFLASNTRATNQYRERHTLAYCLNVYMKPEIKGFFQDRGVDLDEDLYALSEMIQWIWRSRIRERKPIGLYLPSKRMRELLRWWLCGGEAATVQEMQAA